MENTSAESLHSKTLDNEFRRIMCSIKPYILSATNQDHLPFYKKWLEKLTSIRADNKLERNLYLHELYKQIANNTLQEPFNSNPPKGDLLNCFPCLAKTELRGMENKAKIFENVLHQAEQNIINYKDLKKSTIATRQSAQRRPRRRRAKSVVSHSSLERRRTPPLKKVEFSDEGQSFEPNIEFRGMYMPRENLYLTNNPEKRKTSNFRDDSSWSDVTSVQTAASGDSEGTALHLIASETPRSDENYRKIFNVYEQRISQLVSVIRQLQSENATLCTKVSTLKQNEMTDARGGAKVEDGRLPQLENEVKDLHTRLKELSEAKTTIDANETSSTWRDAIEALHKKWKLAQVKNIELKKTIDELEFKIREFSEQSQKTVEEMKQKLEMLHSKDIEALTAQHHKEVADLQRRFSDLLTTRVNEIKCSYEQELTQIRAEYQATIKVKNEAIEKLENVIDDQCLKMHSEVKQIKEKIDKNSPIDNSAYKIGCLENYIIQMDQLYQKSGRNYMRKIRKLTKEIEIKDKRLEQHMMKQKSNVMLTSNSDRQLELNNIVSQLEYVCKKLLESQRGISEQEVYEQGTRSKKPDITIDIPYK